MDRMDSEPNLSIKQPISIGRLLNFDGDRSGDGNGEGTCKQALTLYKVQSVLYLTFWHTDHKWDLFEETRERNFICKLCGSVNCKHYRKKWLKAKYLHITENTNKKMG